MQKLVTPNMMTSTYDHLQYSGSSTVVNQLFCAGRTPVRPRWSTPGLYRVVTRHDLQKRLFGQSNPGQVLLELYVRHLETTTVSGH
jgi:hypothetical protein